MIAPVNRRAMLATMAGAPIAIGLASAPAIGAASTSFQIAKARYETAVTRYEQLPDEIERTDPVAFDREMRALHAAIDAVEAAPVANWQEYVQSFEIACDNGELLLTEPATARLLADARRLLGGERAPRARAGERDQWAVQS